jgi:lipopolysaccharide biosynthesis regulator YciM
METAIILFLLAVVALIIIYVFYDRYQKEKKGKDPRVYIEGLRALLEDRDERAFSKFREVVADDSSNIDAYVRIGNILRKYGKAEKALQVHKDLTLRQALSRDDKITILSALGEDYMSLKKYQAAKSAYKEILSLDNQYRPAAEKLLEAFIHLEDWEGANETRESLIKIRGERNNEGLAIFKFFQGQRLFDRKEYHKARMVFKEALNISDKCTPAYIWIGDSYIAENRLEDAVASWGRMIKAVPDDAHLVLGRLKKALFDLGRFGEISEICKDILSASFKNIDARLTLADYYIKKGEYSMAEEQLNIAVENNPDSYLPILGLAKLYLMQNEKSKLRQLLDRLDTSREALEYQYTCSKCGHKANTRLWLCPSCKAVDSYKR